MQNLNMQNRIKRGKTFIFKWQTQNPQDMRWEKTKNPNFDPIRFRNQPPSHHLHEYPVVYLYSLCMRASVGGLLTWVGICARRRRSLLSRLSAREVAGKLSGPAHDIPLLQRKYSLRLYQVVKLVAFLPARALVSLLSLCGRRPSRRHFLFLFLVPSPPLSTPLHLSLSPPAHPKP